MAVNKVVLGGTIFHLEEGSNKVLNEYLDYIHNNKKINKNRRFEIELMIAEVFLGFLDKGKTEINQQEVLAMIQILNSIKNDLPLK